MQFSRVTFATSLIMSLAACGGGGSDSTAVTSIPTPAPVQQAPAVPVGTAGVYDVNYGQFTGVYTLLDNGDFYGLHFVNNGGILAGHPHGHLSATNSTANLESISWANFIDDAKQVGAQEANGKFGRTFSASNLLVSISGSMGNFATSADRQKALVSDGSKTIYKDPIAMSVMAGTYVGIVRTVGLNKPQENVTGFTIDGDGNFKVTAVNCDFKGTLVQHGVTGIFDVQADVSGATCNLVSPLKGIVTPLALSGSSPYFAVQLDSLDNTQTAVFTVAKQ